MNTGLLAPDNSSELDTLTLVGPGV